MREFPFIISEAFQKGLRTEDTYYDREGYLEACFNLKPDDGGLLDYEGPTDPFNGALTVNFPFPQVIKGQELTLLLSATTIEEVATGVVPWTLSAVSTFSIDDPSVQKAIPVGGVWHFADLGPAFYAFNGSCVLFRSGLDALKSSATTTTYVQDSVTVNTGCTHKGRVFIGGLNQDDIWGTIWQEIFADWEADADLAEMDLRDKGPDSNWVMWGSIGGGDFPLWLFYPETYAQLGLGPPTKESVIERLKRNEMGWAPLRFAGTIQVLKPLGNNVIAYGDEGIEALILRGSGVGFEKIADFGVQGRGAVGGDLKGHVFISEDGQLYELSPSLELTRLGYREWFSSFSANSTAITFNPIWKEFSLCDDSQGYLFRKNGLSTHRDRITSQTFLDGVQYAVLTSAVSTNLRVMTGQHDNQRQAHKYIHDIQVQYQDITNLKIAVWYRYDSNSAFRKWGPVSVSPEGIVTCTITALEFKIELTGTRGTNPRLDRLEVRWSLVDKRAVRGLFS